MEIGDSFFIPNPPVSILNVISMASKRQTPKARYLCRLIEGGVRLGDGLIDFKKLRDVLMEIEWGGWMSIARSRLKGTTSAGTNMRANGDDVRSIFPE